MSTYNPHGGASVAKGLQTTLGIINGVGSLLLDDKNPRDARAISQLKNVSGKLDYAAGTAQRIERAGSAITSFSAQTTILSRSFVDASIIDEPILPNLTKSIHQWYTAQIVSSLHLSQMVDSTRTVQDVMSVVQTGHTERERGVVGNIWARKMGLENFMSNLLGEAGLEALMGPPSPMAAANALAAENDKLRSKPNETNVRSVNTSEHRIGPMGELLEVTLTNPNGNGQSMKVPIFIQMQPSILPEDIAPRFIDMNVSPSTWQRWTQMRAGELTFWKDFLLNRDLIKRQKTILKDPRSAAAFTDFLRTVAKKDKYAIDDATDTLGARQSSNLANSVMIFSEDTVAQAKADSAVDLHNPRDRQRYFKDTYTMIIVIVDPLHQRVTIYFNGLDGEINSSYGDFRPNDSKFDPKELMTALQAFSTNNISRMR